MIPTKTLIPQSPARLLHRPRLLNRLHQQVDRALTLVSAPAGYGKTSLLVEFAHDAPFSVCWLSLDPSERDLFIFVEYILTAVERQFPTFGQTTRRILAPGSNLRNNPNALAGALIQDMLDNVPEFFALVLDDYHAVDDSPEINRLLSILLSHRPDHFRLILSSRTEPVELPLLQLAARGELAGIGQTHLAFTADEIREFMAQTHNVSLSPAQAEELAAESEGWITAIMLSTEAMWRGMRDSLAQARTQKAPVYTYLADQVFAEQTAGLRDFMLASSTLQEMNRELCREVLGLKEVGDAFREIERRGIFVTTVVDESATHWYRYHHLLRDFLQRRLRSQDPDRFRRLHQRAADWFETQEQWEKAVGHRLVVGAPRATAQTMDAGLTFMFYAGRMKTLVNWYQATPEALWPEFPRLLLFAGRALVNTGRYDEGGRLLSQAEGIFKVQGDTQRELLAALDRVVVLNSWGRHTAALSLIEDVLSRGQAYRDVMANAHHSAGRLYLDLGQMEQAIEHLQTSLDLHREAGMTFEVASAALDLSLALCRLGRLEEGWTYQDKAIENYREAGALGFLATLLNNVAYERHYLTGDYGPALRYLSEASQIAQETGFLRDYVLTLLTTAELYRDLGALEQAKSLYAQVEEQARYLGDAELINFVLMGLAQTSLLEKEPVAAIGLATQACERAERQKNVWQLGLSCLTLGAARLQAGDPEAALAEIERGRDLLNQTNARRDLTRAYVLLARARGALGDGAGALEVLDRALDLGIQTRTYHHLIIEGQYIFDLLKELQEHKPSDRRPAQIMDRIRRLPDVARRIVGGLEPSALPHPPILRFYGFGPGRVEWDGEPLPGNAWQSALARYLLFYFLIHRERTRDQIAAAFWPNVSRDKAKSSFHVVKHQLHRALGRSVIAYDRGRDHYVLDLDPDCWFDVESFESLLEPCDDVALPTQDTESLDGRQARLEAAVALYSGDFLESYDGAWCQIPRERLRRHFLDAVVELGKRYTAQRQLDRAFGVLSRALAVDPLYEPASRALMRLYALDGRLEAALDHYRQLKRRLEQELETVPVKETQTLYRAIRDGNLEQEDP